MVETNAELFDVAKFMLELKASTILNPSQKALLEQSPNFTKKLEQKISTYHHFLNNIHIIHHSPSSEMHHV